MAEHLADKAQESGAVLLEAKGVCKDYIDGERRLTVLSGVDFTVRAGEFVSIIGQSGSGKSTLLHLLGALDRPTRGTVSLGGQDYARLNDRQLARMRAAQIGFIFQFHHLLHEFTALENALMPGLIAGTNHAGAESRAEELLRRVGLGERLTHRPSKLSGGEQQRVAMARALLNDPAIVLADEPTGNLDTQTAGEVLDFMLQITRDAGKALVLVTHDPAIAARADRVHRITAGRLVAA
jgi:lipoprotein-releasing system ATP-binding protein